MTETTDNFIPYLRLVIYVNILLGICIGVRGVGFRQWPIVPKDVGSRPSNRISFLMFLFFFSLLLSQCDFNINLMPYSVFPTFFYPL